jgi:tetratricopeptide (TPR) repeat protein
MREALASMRADPLGHASILWRKLRATLGAYEVPDNHFLEWDARYVAILRAPLPGFAVAGTLSLLGALAFAAWLALGRPDVRANGAATSVLAFAALYLATVVLTVTSERVRLPLVPLLLPFAGFALAEATRRTGWMLLPAAALAALAVLVPVLPAGMREQDFDERDYNLAVRLLADGELEGARPIAERLAERHRGSARVLLLSAEIDYRSAREALDASPERGRIPGPAAERITSALNKLQNVSRRGDAQERYRADVLAGAIRQYLGQWREAETAYRSALAFDAEDRDVRRRLAVVLAERAMQQPAGERRDELLRQSLILLDALIAESSHPELGRLSETIRAQLSR